MTIRAMVNITDLAAVGVGASTASPTVMNVLPDIVLVLSAVWLVIRTAEWLWRIGVRLWAALGLGRWRR